MASNDNRTKCWCCGALTQATNDAWRTLAVQKPVEGGTPEQERRRAASRRLRRNNGEQV